MYSHEVLDISSKFFVAVLIQLFGYLKIFFLFIGTMIMCKKMRPNLYFDLRFILLITLLSVAIASMFSNPGLIAEHYFVSVSIRILIMGVVFLYCAYLISNQVQGKNWARIFAICLAAHAIIKQGALLQGIYFLIGEPLSISIGLIALADIPLQVFLALALVGWVTQSEHETARRDSLTGLPNRLWLEENFNKCMSELSKTHKRAAFIFIDIDNFKAVNDSFGHETGDILLKEVGKRLRAITRQNDMVCRLGGDEFVWVLPISEESSIVLERAEQFRNSIKTIDSINGHKISISCSMGIAWYSEQQQDLGALTRQSDRALYTAKEQGKNQVVAFT